MFCMLEYEVRDQADFDFLDALFSDLDEAVERSGMFKYQHVSCGIVCVCMRSPYVLRAHSVERDYTVNQSVGMYALHEVLLVNA